MVFEQLSQITGIGANALRLLITVLLGYPVAYVYRIRFLKNLPGISVNDASDIRNYYVVFTGIVLSLLFNGSDIKHSAITIVVTYLLCKLVGEVGQRRDLAAGLVFIFNAVYLLAGYYEHMGMDYDLTWTMPQCVLCLRMMGFGMDYSDGAKSVSEPKVEVSKDSLKANNSEKKVEPTNKLANKKRVLVSFSGDTSLSNLPPFLHFLGYSYFFSAFLVGPQFSFSLYAKYIRNENIILNKEGKLPSGWDTNSRRCFLLGLGYLVLQQVLDMFFPSKYMLTSDFLNSSLYKRLFVMWFTGRGFINKYLGIWVLNEGACILSGLSFNGYTNSGVALWDGLTNIDTYAFETATSLQGIIECFNINTNLWVKNYVFKRLRFLNNKDISAIGALVFLAIWHGFHSGYLITFLLEYFDVEVEKYYTATLKPLSEPFIQKYPLSKYFAAFACYLYTSGSLYYAIMGFGFLKYDVYSHIYRSLYFIGHIATALAYIRLRTMRKPNSSIKKGDKKDN